MIKKKNYLKHHIHSFNICNLYNKPSTAVSYSFTGKSKKSQTFPKKLVCSEEHEDDDEN